MNKLSPQQRSWINYETLPAKAVNILEGIKQPMVKLREEYVQESDSKYRRASAAKNQLNSKNRKQDTRLDTGEYLFMYFNR